MPFIFTKRWILLKFLDGLIDNDLIFVVTGLGSIPMSAAISKFDCTILELIFISRREALQKLRTFFNNTQVVCEIRDARKVQLGPSVIIKCKCFLLEELMVGIGLALSHLNLEHKVPELRVQQCYTQISFTLNYSV